MSLIGLINKELGSLEEFGSLEQLDSDYTEGLDKK